MNIEEIKNTLREFQAQNSQKFKNNQAEFKKVVSYKKKCIGQFFSFSIAPGPNKISKIPYQTSRMPDVFSLTPDQASQMPDQASPTPNRALWAAALKGMKSC